MTTGTAAATAILFVLMALLAHGQSTLAPAQEPTPSFRTVTDVVTIDVFAHRDRRPLTGLTRDDFVVRDNGVVQQIDTLGTTDSAHVIIGLDLSGSVDGETLERLRTGVRAAMRRLTAADRVSLFTFADRIRVLVRAGDPAGIDTMLDGLTAAGSTTLHDAIVLGTALARADSRPAVFLLFTDGHDTGSWNTARRALDALRYGSVVVYPVGAGLPDVLSGTGASDYFNRPTWLAPLPGDTLRLLQEVADATGGEFLRVGRLDRLDDTFSTILARYRQRYLLSFTPTGVETGDGWHRIEVKLRKRQGSIVAREGYMARR